MIKFLKAFFVSLLMSVPLTAQEVTGGWHEAVIVTDNKDNWVDIMVEAGGWQEIDSGVVDKKWLDYWGVDAPATYSVVGNPGTERGYIRFVEFEGLHMPMVRPTKYSWDVGGIFDINLRVKDMAAAKATLTMLGFRAQSDPVSFTFGPFEVTEWIPRGPDGVKFAMIQRIKPELEGWPHLKKFSRSFNATMVVADMDEATRFWADLLGFQTYLEHSGASKEAGPNVLGIPEELATEIVRDVLILHPQKLNEGSIELLKFNGLNYRDFSSRAKMPVRGIQRLRFPVNGLDALVEKANAMGFEVEAVGTDMPISGIGTVNAATIVAPGGSHITFYEKH